MFTKKDLIKLNGLIYLHVINQLDSKRKAADDLTVAVDTITKYVDNLEHELGVPLLSATGRGSAVTPEGKHIIELSDSIHKVLRDIDTFTSNSVKPCGTVRLAILEGVGGYLMPHGVTDFFDKYPEISIEGSIYPGSGTLNSNEADVVVDYEKPRNSDLEEVYSCRIRCGLVASPEYLRKHGTPKSIQDLCENHSICTKRGHDLLLPGWKEILANAKHISYNTNSIHSLRAVVRNGGGVGVFPYYNLNKVVPLTHLDYSAVMTVYLIAHKATRDKPKVKVLLDYVKSLMEDFPDVSA